MMMNETLARRYAQAVFQLANERGAVQRAGKDLHTLADAVYGEPAAKEFFLSPIIDRKEKIRLFAVALSGKADEIALNTLLLLVRKRRESLLPQLVRQFDALAQQARGAEPLLITSARELSKEELRSMTARLERVYGKTFEVKQRVDPKLIGGVRVTMGDQRVDGSIEGRLQELSRTLFAKN